MFTTITKLLKLNFVFTMDSDTNIPPINRQTNSLLKNSENSEEEQKYYDFELLNIKFYVFSNSFTNKYSKPGFINTIEYTKWLKFDLLIFDLKDEVKCIQDKNDFLKTYLSTNMIIMKKNEICDIKIIRSTFKENMRLFEKIEKGIKLISEMTFCLPSHNIVTNSKIQKNISNITDIVSKMEIITYKMITVQDIILETMSSREFFLDLWIPFYRNIEYIFFALNNIKSFFEENFEITFEETHIESSITRIEEFMDKSEYPNSIFRL